MLTTEKNRNKSDHKYYNKNRTKGGQNAWELQGCILQLNTTDNFLITRALQKCRERQAE